ncbi:hypothetical protein DM860_002846 [Cuscuta australis]|uniref:Uncharacterized protein n=1 Tax=Cuscuta australis TaxID=267555 RepID=A0A328D5X7_9ASTE|nr:hypothetical protein DM860_002846 [Cuscuta australis]
MTTRRRRKIHISTADLIDHHRRRSPVTVGTLPSARSSTFGAIVVRNHTKRSGRKVKRRKRAPKIPAGRRERRPGRAANAATTASATPAIANETSAELIELCILSVCGYVSSF